MGYRYTLIVRLPKLVVIDGNEITVDEKEKAIVSIYIYIYIYCLFLFSLISIIFFLKYINFNFILFHLNIGL